MLKKQLASVLMQACLHLSALSLVPTRSAQANEGAVGRRLSTSAREERSSRHARHTSRQLRRRARRSREPRASDARTESLVPFVPHEPLPLPSLAERTEPPLPSAPAVARPQLAPEPVVAVRRAPREVALHDARETDHVGHDAHPRFFLELGGGIGITHLMPGRAPDRLPETETMNRVAKSALNERTGEIDLGHADRELRSEGWDCETRRSADGRLLADNCVVAAEPGLAADPILDLAIGYHVLPRLLIALTGVVQMKRGHGPMAGLVVGARGEYLLTRPKPKGAQVGLVAGLGVGSIQAHPRGAHHEAPHATNTHPDGIGASVSLGFKASYRVSPRLSFGLLPLLNVGMPNVLFDMGMTLGSEIGVF